MTWSPGVVALFAAVALVLTAWVVHLYRARELPVPGRGVLAAMRVAVVLLLLALLFDPPLPGSLTGPGTARNWTLVDGSLSMGASSADPAGVTGAWSRAVSAAADADGPVLVFGTSRPAPLDDLDSTGAAAGPGSVTSHLTPALEVAAESGARRVTLVTDLRLSDGREAVAAAERLGLEVEVQDVGREAPNAAVETFVVPAALGAGEEVPATLTVAATDPGGTADDSVTVEIREGERLVASRRVPLPGEGRRARLELILPAPDPGGEGAVRYEARARLEGDTWPDDDARAAWADVDPEEGALVLLSVRPDWEPRFLLPVLGSVTGLRTRGLLRVGPDRWLVMDPGGSGTTVDDARAAREARGAELLVVQGGGADGPPWLPEVVEGSARTLVLARVPADAALAGVTTGGAVPGEWYPAPDVPSSPVAAALAGLELSGLPPLGPLLPLRGGSAEDDGGGASTGGLVTALRVRRGPGAAQEPALVLQTSGAGRRAVSLAPDWWRWAFRTRASTRPPGGVRGPGASGAPAGSEVYRRLWSGVAGWLLAAPGPSGPTLRPVSRIVARGAPVDWVAGGGVDDRVSLTVTGSGGVVLDTTVAVPGGGRWTTPPLPPGRYEWRGRTADATASSGAFEVEAWTPELLHPRVEDLARDGPTREERKELEGAGSPLRTHPLPYLLILGLLSAEWIGRRRRGLR